MRDALIIISSCLLLACGEDDHDHCSDGHVDEECPAEELAHTVFVAHEGTLVSYELGTGEERAGSVDDVDGPVDMQALADGTVMVNLTGRDEILAIDGYTMREEARIASSGMGGTRPVHSYITPDRHMWLTLNDGAEGEGTTAAFVDVRPGAATRFEIVGEVELGVGHHEAAFSRTLERVVISNAGDFENVATVYDYSDLSDIRALLTVTGEDVGFDAGEPGDGELGCDTADNGKTYCNLTSSGDILVIDTDADEPTFYLIPTSGSGGGETVVHPDGRYVFSLQEEPRGECQVGQLAVIDSRTDALVTELPLGYDGGGCDDDLAGTDAETARPDHLTFTHDGETLYVGVGGGFEVTSARVDQHLVVDLRDPAEPEQLDSLQLGLATGHSAAALTGDGEIVVGVDSVDDTLTLVDAPGRERLGVIQTESMPKTVATFGSEQGPSEQVGPFRE